MWEYTGQSRPDFAQQPGPGQESAWDYPRPPALVASDEQVGEAIQQKKRRGGVKSARGQKHSQSSIPFMKIKKFARARRQKS